MKVSQIDLTHLLLLTVLTALILIVIDYGNIDYVDELEQENGKVTQKIDIEKNTVCYADHKFDEEEGFTEMDDVLLSRQYIPRTGKTIFFHETTCSKTGILKLNARQACAVESAALLNPNFDIFVLFASPVTNSKNSINGTDLLLTQALQSYKNIYLRNVNLWRYAHDTPIQMWVDKGTLFNSKYIEQHIADFLRPLTLWRWGGITLDLDFILKKTLENIKPNFVAIDKRGIVGGAVTHLDFDGIGNEIAIMLLQSIESNFDPYYRQSIGGPYLTDVLKRICKTNNLKFATGCDAVKFFDNNEFFSVGLYNWSFLFDENCFEETMQLTNESIGIHLGNEISKHGSVRVGSKVPYGVYAQKYCPKVYSSCGEFF